MGKGGYATVYLGRWQGTDVAVKQLNVSQLPAGVNAEFESEAKIHAKCNFPRIARLFGITQEPGHFALVMEYLPKGSLYDMLDDKRIDLPWPTRWQIAVDVGTGLAYLHGAKILHQDLKSLNVLLDNDLRAKITDFGQSKVKTHTATTTTQVAVKTTGTVRWSAPETFKRDYKFSEPADVYSYGMILWEIATRTIPYANQHNDMVVIGWIKDNEKETIPADCPPEYARAITAAWQPAASRPSADILARDLERSKPAPLPAAAAALVVKQPWHFDREKRNAGVVARSVNVLRKIVTNWRSAGIAETSYELFPAGQEDIDKVMKSYFQHPVHGHDVASIEVIHNPDLHSAFAARLNLLQNRHGNPAFAPNWQTEGNPAERAQRQSIDKLHQTLCAPYPETSVPNVRLAPFWHGTDPAILDSVFKTGFANLATTDSGFFGKGLYATGEADYAYRVYATQNGARVGALLMTWVSSYSAFPVIDGDAPKIATKGNYKNYDAHFVPVRPRNLSNPQEMNYDPCTHKQPHQYTEMVVFDAAQCLPRYIVHLKPNGPMPTLAGAALATAMSALSLTPAPKPTPAAAVPAAAWVVAERTRVVEEQRREIETREREAAAARVVEARRRETEMRERAAAARVVEEQRRETETREREAAAARVVEAQRRKETEMRELREASLRDTEMRELRRAGRLHPTLKWWVGLRCPSCRYELTTGVWRGMGVSCEYCGCIGPFEDATWAQLGTWLRPF